MDEYIRKQDASDAVIKHLQLDYDYAWGVREAIDAVFSLCEDCDSGYCGSCRVNYQGGKDVIKVIRNLLNWRRRER